MQIWINVNDPEDPVFVKSVFNFFLILMHWQSHNHVLKFFRNDILINHEDWYSSDVV